MQSNSQRKHVHSDAKDSARNRELETEPHSCQAEANPVDSAAIISEREIKASVITGVVTDCQKLNIRASPSIDAEVVLVIPALTEVTIDLVASNDAFYKVSTADGIAGFCMKKFIALRR